MTNTTYEAQAPQFNTDRTHPGRWTTLLNIAAGEQQARKAASRSKTSMPNPRPLP